jgi:hypothetical protein
LSGVEGEAIEATTCSRGEAVNGALCRWRHAPDIGGIKACSVSGQEGGDDVEDLKRASGENLLSVERAAHAPDIYMAGQMRDAHSVRRVTHFERHIAHYFYMRDTHLMRRVALLFPMGNTWLPNGRCALIRHVAL